MELNRKYVAGFISCCSVEPRLFASNESEEELLDEFNALFDTQTLNVPTTTTVENLLMKMDPISELVKYKVYNFTNHKSEFIDLCSRAYDPLNEFNINQNIPFEKMSEELDKFVKQSKCSCRTLVFVFDVDCSSPAIYKEECDECLRILNGSTD